MSYRPMTGDEWMAFLLADARPAILATTRSDGRPHAAPVWIDVDQGAVWFNTGADTVKGRNLARTGVASICVQDDRPPFSFVVVEGTVVDTIEPSPPDVREALAARYLGAEGGRAFIESMGDMASMLFVVRPDRWLSADFSDDA